jgi:hypothetical protein
LLVLYFIGEKVQNSMIAMSNPLDKLRKLKGRSWSELRTRGEQVLAGYTEQIGLGEKALSDNDLRSLLNKSLFGTKKPTAEDISKEFYKTAQTSFFPSFAGKKKTLTAFRETADNSIIEKANRIVDGRFDLLGYENLDLGAAVDWHYEPVSGKFSPLKHWKQFDELDCEETGDKKILWEINRQQHLFTLGTAFWLTNDERYAATFVRHVDSWMEQNQPGIGVNWLSSLEVSFRAISWLWALNFFRDSTSLTPEFVKEIIKFLYLHGKHLEKYLSTYYSPNTHLTGEALGLYYLGTQLPFLQRAKHWRTLGSEILLGELDRQILSDGVYFEQSTWYARYTADFYTHFIVLKTLNGDNTEPVLHDKLLDKTQLLFDYLMYMSRPDGTTPIIGDDDGGRMLPHSNRQSNDFRASLATASVLFNRGDYKFVAREFSEESLWLLGTDGLNRFESLSTHLPKDNSRSFPIGGYFVMRDGWTDTDNYLLLDCGVHGAMNCGHSHADALAIDVAVGGRTLLVDPGTYTYHESKEWRDFFRSTSAHNTLSIDNRSSSEPNGKFSWNSAAEATPKTWISEDRFDYFEGSQNGYERLESGAATHNRSILFLKNDYWIQRDYVETFGTHSYQMNFHFDSDTNPNIEGVENGTWCVNESPEKGAGLRLFTFGDNGQWQKKESWISPRHGMKVNAPFLRFVSEGIGSQEFFTFMLPTGSTDEQPEVIETEVAGGRAFVINYKGYKDLFVFADVDGNLVRTELFDTDFRFLWARMSEGDTLPEEFVLINGTNFRLGGREVVNYPQRLKFATARRLGNKLNVRTDQSIFSVSIPQSRSSIRILKGSEQS